jgi:2-polyprenyl-3-methyl-5-hydroxy-6-metoxy-1,4-benzoquinol methylase
MPATTDKRIIYIPDFNALKMEADVVPSFEVCEHLADSELDEFLLSTERNLKSNGRLIVSVPIMIGCAVIAK